MAPRRQCARLVVAPRILSGLLLLAIVSAPGGARAIPVFARIYDKPCSACHTVYPQLNPEGERFRANGLHGFTPAVEPIKVGRELELPGTLPLAISLAAGGDFIKVDVPGQPSPVSKRFNLEFLSVLVGAELGPHLAFLGDYAPLFTNPRTGEEIVNTRAGIAFLQAHGEAAGWLGNARLGLFELPLGVSPRVHRLSVQGYLVYGVDAFSMLGRPQPDRHGGLAPQETLNLGSTQLGLELSALRAGGFGVSLGSVAGSNNREDQNHAKDVFLRVSQAFGFHHAGLFLYYSPDVLAHQSPTDRAFRVGPDATLYWRSVQITGQLLAAHDANPTGRDAGMWWLGGFGEVDWRLTPQVVTLLRLDHVGMPTFDDRTSGGETHVRRSIWETTGGAQWLIEQNLKLIVEATYDANHEAIRDATVETWSVTVRLATAFWPLTPPLLGRFFDRGPP